MPRSEEHTSELQSHVNLVCRLLLEKKKKKARDAAYLQKITETYPIHPEVLKPLYEDWSSFTKFQRMRVVLRLILRFFFFFKDTATTDIYTLSLHDALPI